MGVSVKQNNKCPITNYSVYNFLNNDRKTLKEIFIGLLKDNNITCITKENRPKINKIFYNRNNTYFNELARLINENKENIKDELAKFINLYCDKLMYDTYEFDGNKFIKLNENISSIIFEELQEYYKN